MAKQTKNRKPVSSFSKGLICLVLLCALTVFVSCLGLTGMKLDKDGVNVLLPWVPTSSSNWPASLPLNRVLGGGNYVEYTVALEDGADINAVAKAVSDRLDGVGESDKAVTVKGTDTIRVEMRDMETARLASLRSLVTMSAHFQFQDAEGNVVLTEKDVKSAILTMNSNRTTYLVNATITDEGVKKLEEAGVSYVSVYLDGEQVSSFASINGHEVSMSFLSSNFNTASNVAYLLRTGAVDATLTMKENGKVDASASTVKTVVLLVAAVLLVCAAVYMIVKGKLTGISGIWMVWCMVLLGLFFVATIVVPTTYVLSTGCLIAALLGILLAVYTAVTRTDAIGAQIKEGYGPKQASKLGFRTAAKETWIVHGGVLALALILMIFGFSRPAGYTLFAFVVASAISVVLMRAFQACFTAMSNKASLFGKTK
ncbi:MAG: hypothetical protein IJ189_02405 [Clostridia bacterium]|nr:hypothetical protein [Clostridia bacterium]